MRSLQRRAYRKWAITWNPSQDYSGPRRLGPPPRPSNLVPLTIKKKKLVQAIVPLANIVRIISMPKLLNCIYGARDMQIKVLINFSSCDILNGASTTKRKGTQKGSHDMSKARQFVFTLSRCPEPLTSLQLNAQIL